MSSSSSDNGGPDLGGSPQMPEDVLQRKTATVRMWTDDVVTKSSEPSPAARLGRINNTDNNNNNSKDDGQAQHSMLFPSSSATSIPSHSTSTQGPHPSPSDNRGLGGRPASPPTRCGHGTVATPPLSNSTNTPSATPAGGGVGLGADRTATATTSANNSFYETCSVADGGCGAGDAHVRSPTTEEGRTNSDGFYTPPDLTLTARDRPSTAQRPSEGRWAGDEEMLPIVDEVHVGASGSLELATVETTSPVQKSATQQVAIGGMTRGGLCVAVNNSSPQAAGASGGGLGGAISASSVQSQRGVGASGAQGHKQGAHYQPPASAVLPSGPSMKDVIRKTLLAEHSHTHHSHHQHSSNNGHSHSSRPHEPSSLSPVGGPSQSSSHSYSQSQSPSSPPPVPAAGRGGSAPLTLTGPSSDLADPKRYTTIVSIPKEKAEVRQTTVNPYPRNGDVSLIVSSAAGKHADASIVGRSGAAQHTCSQQPSASTSLTSITRLYRPAPVEPLMMSNSIVSKSDVGVDRRQYGINLYEDDSDGEDSIGSYEAVSLAADLGNRPPRLTRRHLRSLSSNDGGEEGGGGGASSHGQGSNIGGGSSTYRGGGAGGGANVPGIELCFDNLTIEAKQGFFFGTRKDMGGSKADYNGSYIFSKGENSGQGDFVVPTADNPSGLPGGGGSRWSFLWRSFQKGIAVQNVSGIFPTRGLHVIFCQDRFVGGTMLKTLAGLQRRSNTVVSGVALGNGLPVIPSVFRERRIFVSTSEICIKDATVMDNLKFAVNMRINTAYTDLLVLKAAEWTCLSSYLDVKVQHLRPCQVYMLAVAMELVLDPSILFLSYPLDDLNISDQGEVIAMLRRLAKRKSIVISLDTMPFALSEGISQVLLLSREGKMVFSGTPDGLQSFLSRLKREDTVADPGVGAGARGGATTTKKSASSGGKGVGGGSSRGPHLDASPNESADSGEALTALDASKKAGTIEGPSSTSTRKKDAGASLPPLPLSASNKGNSSVQYGFYGGVCNAVDLMRLWEAENLIPQVVAAFTQSNEFKTLKGAVTEHKRKATLSGADGGFHRVPRTVPHPPMWLKRNALLLRYMVRTTLLRSDFLFSWLFLVLSFIACISLGDSQASDQGGMQNLRGIIFFLLNCVVHVNVMFVESESLERESFSHLRNNRYFNVVEFYGATMIRLLVPRFVFSLLTALFAKMVFVAASPLAVLSGLTSFTHSLLVLLMVYLWPRPQDVVFIQLLYYAYSVVFCGFLINITSIPKFFSAISLLRPGYGGAISHVLRNKPYSCENVFDHTRNITVVAYCYTGDQYLKLQGFSHDGLGINSAQLCITAAVLMVLVLLSMMVF